MSPKRRFARRLWLLLRGIPPRGRFTLVRRILQLTILILFTIQLPLAGLIIEGSLASARILRTIPLMDLFAWLEQTLATWSPSFESITAVLVVVGVYSVLGRFFCGWVCPMDIIFSLFERKLSSPRAARLTRPHVSRGWEKRIPLVFIVVYLVLSLILGQPFFTTISPVAGTTKLTATLVGILYNIPGATIGLVLAWTTTTLFAVALNIVAEHIFGIKRFWCRFVCPIGAIYGFTMNKYSPLRVRVVAAERCRGCNICSLACPVSIDLLSYINAGRDVRDYRCFNCGRCVEVCPYKVLSLNPLTKKKKT